MKSRFNYAAMLPILIGAFIASCMVDLFTGTYSGFDWPDVATLFFVGWYYDWLANKKDN